MSSTSFNPRAASTPIASQNSAASSSTAKANAQGAPPVAGDVVEQPSRQSGHDGRVAGLQAGLDAPRSHGKRKSSKATDAVEQAFRIADAGIDLKDRDSMGVPKDLYSPITMSILREPTWAVSVADDGTEFRHVFDKADLAYWIAGFKGATPRSPVNNLPLKKAQTFDVDTQLQRAIGVFLARDPEFHAKLTGNQRRAIHRAKNDVDKAMLARSFMDGKDAADAKHIGGSTFQPPRPMRDDERPANHVTDADLLAILGSLTQPEQRLIMAVSTRRMTTEEVAVLSNAVLAEGRTDRRILLRPLPNFQSGSDLGRLLIAGVFWTVVGQAAGERLSARYPIIPQHWASSLGAGLGFHLAIFQDRIINRVAGLFSNQPPQGERFQWIPFLAVNPRAQAEATANRTA